MKRDRKPVTRVTSDRGVASSSERSVGSRHRHQSADAALEGAASRKSKAKLYVIESPGAQVN